MQNHDKTQLRLAKRLQNSVSSMVDIDNAATALSFGEGQGAYRQPDIRFRVPLKDGSIYMVTVSRYS